MMTQEWVGQVVEEARKRQKAVRQVSETIMEIAESSGCAAQDIVTDLALLVALREGLNREQAIDMVNRTQNKIIMFIAMSAWENHERDYTVGR
jgi:hypothetical protein